MFGVKLPKCDTDIHQMLTMVNQIPKGKTDHGRVLWGRGARHKNPAWCTVGSLGFHPMCGFDVTPELADVTVADWMDDRSWFNTKSFIDASGANSHKPIKNDSFSQHTEKVLKMLGLPQQAAPPRPQRGF